MTEEWWDKIYETAALDMRDAYVQRLLNEFRYLSEKENEKNGAPNTSPLGDETS
jgi:hypothetical protein